MRNSPHYIAIERGKTGKNGAISGRVSAFHASSLALHACKPCLSRSGLRHHRSGTKSPTWNHAWILEITSPTCIDLRPAQGTALKALWRGEKEKRRKKTTEQIRRRRDQTAHLIHHRSQLPAASCNRQIDKWAMGEHQGVGLRMRQSGRRQLATLP